MLRRCSTQSASPRLLGDCERCLLYATAEPRPTAGTTRADHHRVRRPRGRKSVLAQGSGVICCWKVHETGGAASKVTWRDHGCAKQINVRFWDAIFSCGQHLGTSRQSLSRRRVISTNCKRYPGHVRCSTAVREPPCPTLHVPRPFSTARCRALMRSSR
jgi:hypothetical protein